MHYYQFNIADYRKDTVHLSPMEHFIYRQLIDWYYLDEKPIPRETQVVMRRLGLGSSGLSELENVLNDFFKMTQKGWTHSRIERDLNGYKEKRDISRRNGSKGGRPKKQELSEVEKPRRTQPVISGNPDVTQTKPNHKPRTINQEPSLRKDANASCTKPSVSHSKMNGAPYQKIVDIYHETLPMLRRVRTLTDNRKNQMRLRCQNEFPDLDTWQAYFEDIGKSKFLTGQADPVNGGRVWQADIDWLLKPGNIAKVSEGKYHG